MAGRYTRNTVDFGINLLPGSSFPDVGGELGRGNYGTAAILLGTEILGPLGKELRGARAVEKAGAEASSAIIHKNSLDYVGDTHVYRIIGPDGKTFKIGESAQGVRKSDGASIRAEQQARALQRETGETYYTEIIKNYSDKATARQYETKVIERFRSLYGDTALPGNKTNR